ncbi:unnamed protein product [Pieris macdunnoughi]|uniref:Uncharacterized protein n=1 Tax=Pieris macdunnoughi TaxID=345717 RepID=A0A821T6M5_9NEOP|nr:unnamed protein product [Pieris macdunnoughi]
MTLSRTKLASTDEANRAGKSWSERRHLPLGEGLYDIKSSSESHTLKLLSGDEFSVLEVVKFWDQDMFARRMGIGIRKESMHPGLIETA